MGWLYRMKLTLFAIAGSVISASLLTMNCIGVTDHSVGSTDLSLFPYTIEGTQLVVLGICGYEGPFVEDGTDREVVDVAALIIHNAGQKIQKDLEITVACQNGDLCFLASCIPPDACTIVLEKDAQLWIKQQALAIYSDTNPGSMNDCAMKNISIHQIGMDSIQVMNLGDETARNIMIRYKTWSEEMQIYIGGITYQICIEQLEPGHMRLIKPTHYAAGYSSIVEITKTELP